MLFNFTFQDASPLIRYSGTGWIAGTLQGYDGSYRSATTSGDRATINFVGSSVSLFGALRNNHGNFTVNLDQDAPFTGSSFATVDIFQQPLFEAPNLTYASHQLTFTNVPLSTNLSVTGLDFVTIQRQIGEPSDQAFQVTLDDSDTSSSIVYTPGAWSPISATSAFQATLHQTTVAQAQVTILFQGCCIEIYGQYANAQYTVTLDNKAPVPFQGLDLDLTSDLQDPQTLLYLMDGLSEDTHNVTLTNTNANPKRPFFFDYAVVRSTKNFSNTTGSGTGGSGNTTAAGGSGNTSATSNKTATPIAPIVGGIVGGLLVLAILATAAFLVVRRRRRRPADSLTPENPSENLLEPYFVARHVSMNGAEAHMQNLPSNPGAHTKYLASFPPTSPAAPLLHHRGGSPLPPSSTASDLSGADPHTTVFPENTLPTAALSVNLTGSHARTLSDTSGSTAILSHATGQTRPSATEVPSSPMTPPISPSRNHGQSFPQLQNDASSSQIIVPHTARIIQEEDAGITFDRSNTSPIIMLPPAYSSSYR
ncbi:hypothetical protein BU17DRAFT_79291 [Hysterangium stoloniferum]|nr:hypothetical protein BU17DRAFT_79291 [Hysterangium stoloniferum]